MRATMKIAAAIPLLMLPLLLIPAIAASPPAGGLATGSFSESISVTSSGVSANGVVITFSIKTMYSGEIVGVASITETETIHLDGSSTFQASGTFLGRVSGSAPGTLQESYSGTGTGATFKGTGQLNDGTGGLASLVGYSSIQGEYTSTTTASGTYDVLFHS